MRRKIALASLLLVLLSCVLSPFAHSSPRVTADRPVEVDPFVVRLQTVIVEVSNHLVKTTVVQEIVNTGPNDIGCSILTTLPEGARATSLSATVDGKLFKGEIRTNSTAQKIVTEAREQKKAAALVRELGGNRLVTELSLIKAGSEFFFTVAYVQQARYENGMFAYDFEITARERELKLPAVVDILVKFRCTAEILRVESDTHTLNGSVTGREANFKAEGANHGSFSMRWALDLKPGVPHVMLKNVGAEDPYFSLLMMPPDVPVSSRPRSFVLILDKSGSMQGSPFDNAVAAMREFVDTLRDTDTVNIMVFDTSVHQCSLFPFKADRAGKDLAKGFINGFRADGGTRFLEPLSKAIKTLKMLSSFAPYVVLFTDGQDNVDRAAQFVTRLGAEKAFEVPIFPLAFGNDVDMPLMRSLALQSGTVVGYIHGAQGIGGALRNIASKLEGAIGHDVAVTTEGDLSYQHYPPKQAVMYRNEPIMVYGRLAKDREIKMSVGAKTAGNWNGARLELTTAGEHTDCDFTDLMWASRRMQDLLDNIQIFGEAGSGNLKQQVIDLSRRFLITSPYTSLVFSETKMHEDPAEEDRDPGAPPSNTPPAGVTRAPGTGGPSTGGSGLVPVGRPPCPPAPCTTGPARTMPRSQRGTLPGAGNATPPPGTEGALPSLPGRSCGSATVETGKPLMNENGQICDTNGVAFDKQVEAAALYAWLRAMHEQEAKQVSEAAAIVRRVVTRRAIPATDLLVRAVAADISKRVPKAVFEEAGVETLLTGADISGISTASDEYLLLTALAVANFVKQGGKLPETLKIALKDELLKRAAVTIEQPPVGKDAAYILRWQKWFVPLLAVSAALGIDTPDKAVKLSLLEIALGEGREQLTYPDFAYCIALGMLDIPEAMADRKKSSLKLAGSLGGKPDSMISDCLRGRANEAMGW